MATLFEWTIGDGYVWIADNPNESENNPADYTVYVDPANVSDWYFKLPEDVKRGTSSGDLLNRLFNSEVPIDDPIAVRIMAYWRSIGSPVIDRKVPGYAAPEFPWTEAGFNGEERDEIIAAYLQMTVG